MHIATNPGSNLTAETVGHYGISLSPQRIHVDGENHDTRGTISLSQVDAWTKTASKWPRVIGSTSAELVQQFKALLAGGGDNQLLSVQTSRRIIQSYTAAQAAKRTLEAQGLAPGTRIEVHDTGVTDGGAGLATILAAEAARAGLPLDDVVALLEAFASENTMIALPWTLENLVKGGRASFLRAWMADVLKVRPLLSMVEGELKAVSKWKMRSEIAHVATDFLKARIEPGRRVWAAVMHGNDIGRARVIQKAIEDTWDVAFCLAQPLSTSIYLNAGPGAVVCFVAPIDHLPWSPGVPSVDAVLKA